MLDGRINGGARVGLPWESLTAFPRLVTNPRSREKFNTYRFADYKEKLIDLLARVTTVSVRTQAITEAMRTAVR